jgi:hypothetical protein
MRTKIIIGLFLVTSISGCRKVDVQQPINLGVVAESTKINKVSPIISNGNSVTVFMSTTVGSKYSLSVTDLLDNELESVGFTAEDINTSKKLDLSNLKNGDYNIILTDIKGSESKINIIIKK